MPQRRQSKTVARRRIQWLIVINLVMVALMVLFSVWRVPEEMSLVPTNSSFFVGADITVLATAEKDGQFRDLDGQRRPGLDMLKRHNFTWIRLRRVNKNKILGAKRRGFKVLLSLQTESNYTWLDDLPVDAVQVRDTSVLPRLPERLPVLMHLDDLDDHVPDLIGVSFFPFHHSHTFAQLRDTIEDAHRRYNKDIIIETAYAARPTYFKYVFPHHEHKPLFQESPQGQRDFLAHLTRVLLATKGAAGLFYYEPFAPANTSRVDYATLRIRSFFDDNRDARPALAFFDDVLGGFPSG